MLRRNGPLMKSVKSVLTPERLDMSLIYSRLNSSVSDDLSVFFECHFSHIFQHSTRAHLT